MSTESRVGEHKRQILCEHGVPKVNKHGVPGMAKDGVSGWLSTEYLGKVTWSTWGCGVHEDGRAWSTWDGRARSTVMSSSHTLAMVVGASLESPTAGSVRSGMPRIGLAAYQRKVSGESGLGEH